MYLMVSKDLKVHIITMLHDADYIAANNGEYKIIDLKDSTEFIDNRWELIPTFDNAPFTAPPARQ